MIDMGPGMAYHTFKTTGTASDDATQAAGGMMNRPAEMPMSAWVYYIHAVDFDAAVDRAKAAGATLVNGPMEVPGGMSIVNMVDPQGGFFALIGQR